MKITAALSSLLVSGVAGAPARSSSTESAVLRTSRQLQGFEDTTTKRCWIQCTELKLTAAECQQLIEEELGGSDLPNHEIGNLQIKIRTPRSSTAYAKSYWFVGIPTDFNGNVACDANTGIVRYPWLWEINYEGGGTIEVPLPEISCLGKTASDCCGDFLAAMNAADIPIVDANGNCMSCYVHQQPLEPIVNPSGSGLLYIDQQWNTVTFSCDDVRLTPAEVQAGDAALMTALDTDADAIQAILDADATTCAALFDLQNTLFMDARTLRKEMRLIGDMLCGLCVTGDETFGPLPAGLRAVLIKLLSIRDAVIESDEQCIIIYTDVEGNVIEPPKIGGSIEGIDWNLADECDEDPDPNPDPLACFPNVPPTEPFCPGGDFDPLDHQCTEAPLGTEVSEVVMPDYSITLVEYDTESTRQGAPATKFVYEVCTSPLHPICHVTISWTAHCIITGYSYPFDDFKGADYRIYEDPYTCVSGLTFNEWWGYVVQNNGGSLATEPACSTLTMWVDGKVGKSLTTASAYVSGPLYAFRSFEIEGPDCSKCPQDPFEPECDPNDPPTAPFCTGGDFDPTDYACTETATATMLLAMEMPDYSIDLKSKVNKTSSKGKKTTVFTYEVCSGMQAIEHVTISWVGTCILSSYSYRGNSFDEFQRDYRIHLDPSTCISGFKFNESWENVAGINAGPVCRDLVLAMDGHVDSTTVDAAIVQNGKFALYQVEGPDCSACSY